MQYLNEIRQKIVGTERRLLVEECLLHIAGIDIPVGKSLQLAVAMILTQQFVKGMAVVAAIAIHPNIGITSALKHTSKASERLPL